MRDTGTVIEAIIIASTVGRLAVVDWCASFPVCIQSVVGITSTSHVDAWG